MLSVILAESPSKNTKEKCIKIKANDHFSLPLEDEMPFKSAILLYTLRSLIIDCQLSTISKQIQNFVASLERLPTLLDGPDSNH